LEEPDDLAGAAFSEPLPLLTFGELAVLPWEPASLLTPVEPGPCPAARPRELRSMPRSWVRPPELPSFLSITRLPFMGCTEILVPVGRRFKVRLERLILVVLPRAAVSRRATRLTFGLLSWSLRTTVRALDPWG
jgi:hypothetical protein